MILTEKLVVLLLLLGAYRLYTSSVFTIDTVTVEKCPYLELFWSSFSRIRTEYAEIQSICPYSVQMRENADQSNSKYGYFSRIV